MYANISKLPVHQTHLMSLFYLPFSFMLSDLSWVTVALIVIGEIFIYQINYPSIIHDITTLTALTSNFYHTTLTF